MDNNKNEKKENKKVVKELIKILKQMKEDDEALYAERVKESAERKKAFEDNQRNTGGTQRYRWGL